MTQNDTKEVSKKRRLELSTKVQFENTPNTETPVTTLLVRAFFRDRWLGATLVD